MIRNTKCISEKTLFSRCGLNVCGERCARMEVHQVICDRQRQYKDMHRQVKTDKDRQLWKYNR